MRVGIHRRDRRRVFAAVAVAAALVGAGQPAGATPADSPLPVFADGKASMAVTIVPGIVKRGRLQTDVLCTSRAGEPVDIGVELFDSAGTRLNDVAAGAGAALAVAPGATVTIGTSTTLALLETGIIPLVEVEQGAARVVASQAAVDCIALIVDDRVTPPVSLGTLGPGIALGLGDALAGAPLPQLAGGMATHSAVFPGVVKRGRMESEVFCTSLAAAPIDLAVQVFGPDGSLLNDVTAGNGTLAHVAPGTTVTFGTTGTMAYLESTVISLPGVSQGVARVVATGAVRCSAQVVDAVGVVPVAMSELAGYAPAAAPPTATATPSPTAPPTATATPAASNTPAATPTALVGCTGDCGSDGSVTIDELVRGVNLALGAGGTCPAFDVNGDGAVTIEELVRAVTVALNGCVAT